MGRKYFSSFYGLVDIVYITLNIVVFLIIFYALISDIFERNKTYSEFSGTTQVLRYFEAISVLLIYVKAGNFLSLIDSYAPLMDNISQVLAAI